MLKAPNALTRLFAAIGLSFTQPLPLAPGLPQFLGVHTNKARNGQRKPCRVIGHRQMRRAKCRSYTLKAQRTAAEQTPA